MSFMTDVLAGLLPRRLALARATEEKASRTGPLISLETLGRPVWSPRDYAAFAREGYMQNAIVYRAVRMISEAAASVPLLLYDGDNEIDGHPFLDLLGRPSPDHTGTDFFEAWYGYLLVAGNAYVEAVALDGQLRELHALRPDRMKVVPGPEGWPEAYEYTAQGVTIRFAEEIVPRVRPILHVRLFHPVNDHYGMSPIEAASIAIDTHNTAAQWNKALLDNSARPSGALVYGGSDGRMTTEQFDRLKSELETSFQGAKQAGRPLLLEGGLDWKPLSLSPKDMDFYEARNAAAREIALALGVPPMLLGIPGDNTYSNYQEAHRALWRNTVLPLVTRTAKALSAWLSPAYGSELALRADLDGIEALSSEREALWARIERASFLTIDEKRAATGYGPMPGDALGAGEGASNAPENFTPSATENAGPSVFHKYRPNQARAPRGSADGGQWVDEGGGGSGSSGNSSSFRAAIRSEFGSDTQGETDASPERVRVAQNASTPRRPSSSRILARFPEASAQQEVRWAISEVWANDAVARAETAIPGYRRRASLTETIEGEISRNESDALEAEQAIVEAYGGVASVPYRFGRPPPRSLDEVCRPSGALIGVRAKGKSRDVTTVKGNTFDRLIRDVTNGAKEVPARSDYHGVWYQRLDGTVIGIRRSQKSGTTIDIIDSGGNPALPSGMRIHFDD